ncbi:hypothetical protein V1264_001886 [Littorina saxatilis]
MPTLHTTSRASPILFVLLLLHVLSSSSAVAQRNDILGASGRSVTSCHCCYVSPRSQCCMDCVADGLTPGREQHRFSPLMPVSRRGESLQNILGQDVDGDDMEIARYAGDRWNEPALLSLPGCQCCMREVHHSGRPSLVLMACCGICEKNKHVADIARHALSHVPHSLDVSARDVVDDDHDVVEKGMTSLQAQKRISSVDCMCCSNSGIADCCSKCRIY